MGKKNQLYGKWIRLIPNPDNPNELYLVIEKDKPMERKYIRQFENMFKGKDVIITITELIRGMNKKKEEESETRKEDIEINPFWSIGEEG